jgi:hypothetical protein
MRISTAGFGFFTRKRTVSFLVEVENIITEQSALAENTQSTKVQ